MDGAMRCLEAISDPLLLSIVRELAERESASAPELAKSVYSCAATVRARVRGLERAGVVEVEPPRAPTFGRPAARYRLTADVRAGIDALLGLACRAPYAGPVI